MKIAVIGGGVAGVVSSYLLSREHEVSLFESADYLGGHTNTITITQGPDAGIAVDTGFIVCNDKNYPNFHAFLKSLGVGVRWSDMSFSHYCEETGFHYAGTTLNGLFSQRSNIVSAKFYSFLWELYRFCAQARKDIEQGISSQTLGEYLDKHQVSSFLRENYILPMGAAIWSAPLSGILEFPAKSFLHFFRNHGLLSVFDRPKWQTVVGGSSAYIKRFKEVFSGTIYLNRGVASVSRDADGVQIKDIRGEVEAFDKVVFAAHADQTRRLLAEPLGEEEALLDVWNYQHNHTILHTDVSLLPPNSNTWASWNYLRFKDIDGNSPVSVTYDMNRLQGLKAHNRYCVTLNSVKPIKPECVVKEIDYLHPVFDSSAIASQDKLKSLNGKNHSYFCGSYFGYGFHEDAVTSAVEVAKQFGISL